MELELCYREIFEAAMVGVMRQVGAMKAGRKEVYGHPSSRDWQTHIEGTLGEMAAAKALNLYWSGAHGHAVEDIRGFEVRSTTHDFGHLLIHKSDSDDTPYLLVVGGPRLFFFPGWILGRDAKRDEFWREGDRGSPAFWVPQSALRPFSELASD